MNFFSVSAQPGLGQHNTWTQTCKFYVCCPACKKYKQVYKKCKINWPWNFWVWKLKSVPKTNPGGLCCILPDRYGLNQGLGMIRNKVERYIVSFSFTGRIIWGKSDHTIWPKFTLGAILHPQNTFNHTLWYTKMFVWSIPRSGHLPTFQLTNQ